MVPSSAAAHQLGEMESKMQIGGKVRKPKVPTKPQVVIQRAPGLNEYALIGLDEKSNTTLAWVGDPNAATKYDSKYDAKFRTRLIDDIPENKAFRVLENS